LKATYPVVIRITLQDVGNLILRQKTSSKAQDELDELEELDEILTIRTLGDGTHM
jgi:hypothetical protein